MSSAGFSAGTITGCSTVVPLGDDGSAVTGVKKVASEASAGAGTLEPIDSIDCGPSVETDVSTTHKVGAPLSTVCAVITS